MNSITAPDFLVAALRARDLRQQQAVDDPAHVLGLRIASGITVRKDLETYHEVLFEARCKFLFAGFLIGAIGTIGMLAIAGVIVAAMH